MSHTDTKNKRTNKTKKKHNVERRIQSKKLNYMDGGAISDDQINSMAKQEDGWIKIITDAVKPYQDYIAEKTKYDLIKGVLEEITLDWDKNGILNTTASFFVKSPASLAKRLLLAQLPSQNRDKFDYYRNRVSDCYEERADELQDTIVELGKYKSNSNPIPNVNTLTISDLQAKMEPLKQILDGLTSIQSRIDKIVEDINIGDSNKIEAVQRRLKWICVGSDTDKKNYFSLADVKITHLENVGGLPPNIQQGLQPNSLYNNLEALKASYNRKLLIFGKVVDKFKGISFLEYLKSVGKMKADDPNQPAALDKYLSMIYTIIYLRFYDRDAGKKFDWGNYIQNRGPEANWLKKIQDIWPSTFYSDVTIKANNFEKLYSTMLTISNTGQITQITQIDQLVQYGTAFDSDSDSDSDGNNPIDLQEYCQENNLGTIKEVVCLQNNLFYIRTENGILRLYYNNNWNLDHYLFANGDLKVFCPMNDSLVIIAKNDGLYLLDIRSSSSSGSSSSLKSLTTTHTTNVDKIKQFGEGKNYYAVRSSTKLTIFKYNAGTFTPNSTIPLENNSNLFDGSPVSNDFVYYDRRNNRLTFLQKSDKNDEWNQTGSIAM